MLESEEGAGLSDQNGEGNPARDGGTYKCSCTESFVPQILGIQQ